MRLLLAAAALTGVAAIGLAGTILSATPTRVEIAFRYSRFAPTAVDVPRGVPVTFVLRNDDPIDHEWIIGPPEVHRAHRTGTEPVHDTRVTEVTVPALGTRVTTITFAEPGTLTFICHLPRHEAYGMVGTLRVR